LCHGQGPGRLGGGVPHPSARGAPIQHGAVVGLRGRAPGKRATITNIRAVAFGGFGDFERMRKMPSVEARPNSDARGGGGITFGWPHTTSMPHMGLRRGDPIKNPKKRDNQTVTMATGR